MKLSSKAGKDEFDTEVGSNSEALNTVGVQFLQKFNSALFDDILSRTPSTPINSDNDPFIILLAISGGCDSVALFHSVCHYMKQNHGVLRNGSEVHVIHFDHCQRGEESDGDRVFVQELCKKNEIPFHYLTWNNENNNEVRFSQEVARDWRRQESIKFICDQSRSGGVILTAHQKDDVEETILLKMLRGVHITNLTGMESLYQSNGDHGAGRQIFFGKPLLDFRKDEIFQFLESKNLSWREDTSNATDKYKRNKVRLQLIPLLQDLVGGEFILEVSLILLNVIMVVEVLLTFLVYSFYVMLIQKRLENVQEQSLKIKKHIDSDVDEFILSSDHDLLHSFPLPEEKRGLNLVEEHALRRWIEDRSNGEARISYEKFNLICGQISHYDNRKWKLDIGSGFSVERTGDIIKLDSPSFEAGRDLHWSLENIISGHEFDSQEYVDSSCVVLTLFMKKSETEFPPQISIKTIDDADDGIRFLPPWRREMNEVKLKAFLRGQKVPLHRRGAASFLSFCMDGVEKVAAIYVENKNGNGMKEGQWVIDANLDTKLDNFDEVKVVVRRGDF